MQLKSSCYQFKIGCYNFKIFRVSAMVTTGENPVVIMQRNMIKYSKHTDTKTHTKKDSKIRNKEQ